MVLLNGQYNVDKGCREIDSSRMPLSFMFVERFNNIELQ